MHRPPLMTDSVRGIKFRLLDNGKPECMQHDTATRKGLADVQDMSRL